MKCFPYYLLLTSKNNRNYNGSSTTKLYNSQQQQVKVNPLVADIKVSKTVEVFSLVKQLQAQGTAVTSLCVGEPDFLPSQSVLDGIKEAVEQGDTRYTAVTGTLELRKLIREDLLRRKGVEYDVNEIIVSNGAKQSVYQGVLAVAGVGDEVIIPAPYWPSYPEMVRLAGATPIILPTSSENGFLIDADALEKVITPNTKLLILCNPSNPTGGVHDLEKLNKIASVLKKHPQVAVMADEIYERLVYDDVEHISFAKIPGMFDRTMTVNGFSKSYAMTGLRLGYVAAPTYLAKAITTIQSQLTSCAGSISQAAGVAALKLVTDEEMDWNVQIMQEKRDYVLSRLDEMGIPCEVPPSGAFYVLPDVSKYYNGDDTQLCIDLLQSKKLALVPGSSFGAQGTVRISYATSLEELGEAMDKLQEFLEEQSS